MTWRSRTGRVSIASSRYLGSWNRSGFHLILQIGFHWSVGIEVYKDFFERIRLGWWHLMLDLGRRGYEA